ncbi:MAG: hypothetical protein JSU65_09855 [Candidatus Zixiibacteriota bacterium]|nr:MAG: hypothetical protein JSU65_09855 [candidate division Zixibacteria bacterium]
MKINPVAIQSYQQISRQNRPDSQEDTVAADQAARTVEIQPQDHDSSSKLAIRADVKNYAELLSPEEQQALELLFGKFNDTGRFGAAYNADPTSSGESRHVGRIIDVKV